MEPEIFIRNPIKGDEAIDDGVWNTRGWTLQERILAPRKVIFCKQKTIWECREFRISEDDMRKRDSSIDEVDRSYRRFVGHPGEDMYLLWYAIVQELTRRNLTRDEDKLPALSGLARELSVARRDRYVAGLWESDMIEGLLWRVLDPQDPEHYPAREVDLRRRGPSWTWAQTQLRGQLAFWNCLSAAEIRTPIGNARKNNATARVLEVTTKLATDTNPFGIVELGNLFIEGMLGELAEGATDNPDLTIWWDQLGQNAGQRFFLLELARVRGRDGSSESLFEGRTTAYGMDAPLCWGLILWRSQYSQWYKRRGTYQARSPYVGFALKTKFTKSSICIV
jgi:hypothetical protein